jgi:hypothetical protein
VEATKFVWDCLNQEEDELLGLLGNQTPLRDCCDFFTDIGGRKFFCSDKQQLSIDITLECFVKPFVTSVDITCKETLDPEESRESKRRRMLEYPLESSQTEVATQETASTLVTSEVLQQPSHVLHHYFLQSLSH